jgi:branched-chain amino acid transport system permease protein
MILSIVVLGGMGSIIGVILAAFLLILLPEYLRTFSEYRMLLFGMTMVLMMLFRPEGIIANISQRYEFQGNGQESVRESYTGVQLS